MATIRLPDSVFKSQNKEHRQKMAAFLQSGDLASIGEKRFNNNSPVTYDAVEEVLTAYGEILVRGFQDELNKSDANASGAGSASIRMEYTKLGKSYEVAIFMAEHLKYVDEGVQGINSNSLAPNSPFKFKFANPSKNHVEALEAWIRNKNVRAIVTVPKGISQTAANKSLAYAMGYSIKQRGLRATYFKKKTIERIIDDMKKDIALAAGDDMKINILF